MLRTVDEAIRRRIKKPDPVHGDDPGKQAGQGPLRKAQGRMAGRSAVSNRGLPEVAEIWARGTDRGHQGDR